MENDRCPWHPERGFFQDVPMCSTCWFDMPEATRKAFKANMIDTKKLLNMAEQHFASIREFGGGRARS